MAIVLLFLSSCDDLLKIDDPKNELPSAVIFSQDETAQSALSGAYSRLSQNLTYISEITAYAGLSADELLYKRNTNYENISNNELDPLLSLNVGGMWANFYSCIYRFNSILEGLDNNTSITPSVSKQIVAEAKFLRAYSYFYLVNFYGDVPRIVSTKVSETALAPRNSKEEIYSLIQQDLLDAKKDLQPDYSASPGLRVNANQWAATALLARVSLYLGDWEQAEAYASEVIEQTSLYKLLDSTELRNVFLKNSEEAILQFGPYMSLGKYTYEGSMFVTTYTTYCLRDELVNAFDGSKDLRKSTWIKELDDSGIINYQPYKYRFNGTAAANAAGLEEYPTVLRLAEQYLIRAEARAKQNKITGETGAVSDLNKIRNRAGLDDYEGSDASDEVLLAIEKERQLELFCELGHRWFDLHRTGRADAVLGALKPSTWDATDVYYPIPQSARDSNPNLTQNAGYDEAE